MAAIVSSIMAVLAGERVMAGAVANRVLDMLTGASTPKEFYDGLTSREVEIYDRSQAIFYAVRKALIEL